MRGMTPLKIPRGPSADDLLEIKWAFPVFGAVAIEEVDFGRTVAKTKRVALPSQDAFKFLAGDDPHPLLVLRECLVCSGTDDALLSAEPDNEKTMLISQWFNCVKLPVDVLKEEHPFYNLFDKKNPPHLFVAAANGEWIHPLETERSRTELWDVLTEALDEAYDGSATRALKEMANLLNKYDLLDTKTARLENEQEELMETHGPKSSKLKKVSAKLDKAKKERAMLDERMRDAAELDLKPQVDEEQAATR
jgi:hypothetical protein